jgi:hypothetical protein
MNELNSNLDAIEKSWWVSLKAKKKLQTETETIDVYKKFNF